MAKPPLDIDLQAIKKLASLLKKSELTEIEYEADGVRIRVGRGREVGAVFSAPLSEPAGAVLAAAHGVVSEEKPVNPVNNVTAPLVGVVYLTPQPGAEPFVKEGDVIQAGAQLLIIEAMKVMNPIRAPHAGKVTKIFVRHGEPVEFGAPLMTIAPVGDQ